MKNFKSLQDKALIDCLCDGGVGVMPTDTVYGLVCSAANETAVRRLYTLKSRIAKLGTIIAADIDQLVGLGIRRSYLKPVEHYWPNPISIVIPVGLQLEYLHRGIQSLTLRIPNDKQLIELLQATGPLLTTSANQPDEPTAGSIKEAEAYFGDTIDFYTDGGDMSKRQPSTIIRIVDDAVEILREGAVTINEAGEIVS